MTSGLFRAEAVAAYRNPDTRGGLLEAGPPSGLLPLGVLAIVLAAGAVAATTLRVQVTATGRGIVRSESGNVVVGCARGGTVTEVRVRAGDAVDAGSPLARVHGEAIVAPIAGSVEYVDVRVGGTLAAGDPVAQIVPKGERLVGTMALPARHRAHLHIGDPVRLDLDEHPATEIGTADATIEHVGTEPLSPARARNLLGDEDAAREPSYVVRLRLGRMPAGSSAAFRSGMTFTGRVTLEEPRAIELVLPRLVASSP